jgi:alpha-galactosidase
VRTLLIATVVVCCTTVAAAWAGGRPTEQLALRQWVDAKFEQAAPVDDAGQLTLVKQFDIVWQNCRVDRPFLVGGRQYYRGLFTHAPSDVAVHLPGPAREFSASVGVDSNEQTLGGHGSVVFTVATDAGSQLCASPVLHEGMAAVPLQVELNGATDFHLRVSETEDGVGCDQAVWVDACVTLADGRCVWLGDLPIVEATPKPSCTTDPPFSFEYGDQTLAQVLPRCAKKSTVTQLDDARRQHELCYRDPETGLQVRCVVVEYRDFPTVEWTLYLKNTGATDTPMIANVRALDATFQRLADADCARFKRPGEFVLHHHTGSICAANDYEPHATALEAGTVKQIASSGGRGSNGEFPYFNIEWPGAGVIVVIGWPGQWQATFARDAGTGLRIAAGQELTHFTLHPGEEVRSPLIVLQFNRGDLIDAQNTWRRWMLADNVPRPNGQLHPLHLSGCSSHFFTEMVLADEASQIEFIDRYLAQQLGIDYWWMDAGWYVNKTGWPHTGTWEVDTKRFPRGLRAISDHAHERGLQTIVWFEPERVTPDTWLYDTHPDWLLGHDGQTKLLDLGNAAARQWLTDHVDKLLTEQGIDLYRQDFNMDPLTNWREHDAPDRQGITEINHVTGYLAFWDELRQRHPGLLIDTCASGGRRNDLETLRRAVPLWRTDYILEPIGAQCCTYGISSWIPFHGTGVKEANAYHFRSTMTPYPNCLWDARRTDLDYDELRRLIAQWRDVAANYAGDFYPLTPYSLDRSAWLGWQFHRPETGEGMVQVFRREGSIYRSADLVLRGLEPAARYTITDLDSPATPSQMTGEQLLSTGLPVEIRSRPGAALYTYRRCQE